MHCLYILEINPLSVASFANILSHSDNCIFHLIYLFIGMQKFLSLIRSYLFIYFYYSWRWIVKDLSKIYVKECFACVFL